MPQTSANEDLSTSTTAAGATGAASAGSTIDNQTYLDMLEVLEDLLSHTHTFYDDYGTACNCNCNCNCTRGTL